MHPLLPPLATGQQTVDQLSRRGLLGVAGILTLSSCGILRPSPGNGPPNLSQPQLKVRSELADELIPLMAELVSQLEAHRAANRPRQRWLRQSSTLHREHAQILRNSTAELAVPAATPTRGKKAWKRLLQREEALAAELTRRAVHLDDGQTALLLASMAAAIEQQLAVARLRIATGEA